MKKLFILPLAVLTVLVLVAGCRDLQRDHVPTAAQLDGVLLSESGDDGSTTGPSTVCVAYASQLGRAQQDGDAERVAVLEAIIDDACN